MPALRWPRGTPESGATAPRVLKSRTRAHLCLIGARPASKHGIHTLFIALGARYTHGQIRQLPVRIPDLQHRFGCSTA